MSMQSDSERIKIRISLTAAELAQLRKAEREGGAVLSERLVWELLRQLLDVNIPLAFFGLTQESERAVPKFSFTTDGLVAHFSLVVKVHRLVRDIDVDKWIAVDVVDPNQSGR